MMIQLLGMVLRLVVVLKAANKQNHKRKGTKFSSIQVSNDRGLASRKQPIHLIVNDNENNVINHRTIPRRWSSSASLFIFMETFFFQKNGWLYYFWRSRNLQRISGTLSDYNSFTERMQQWYQNTLFSLCKNSLFKLCKI